MAILANTFARSMGATRDSVKTTYGKMKIADPLEEAGIRHYQGTLEEQLDAHVAYVAEQKKAGELE